MVFPPQKNLSSFFHFFPILIGLNEVLKGPINGWSAGLTFQHWKWFRMVFKAEAGNSWTNEVGSKKGIQAKGNRRSLYLRPTLSLSLLSVQDKQCSTTRKLTSEPFLTVLITFYISSTFVTRSYWKMNSNLRPCIQLYWIICYSKIFSLVHSGVLSVPDLCCSPMLQPQPPLLPSCLSTLHILWHITNPPYNAHAQQ